MSPPTLAASNTTNPTPSAAPVRVVNATCPHDCPDTCAMHVSVQDGRVIRIQGAPDHPTTQGVLCTKVSRYNERTHHPERVLHPLKRVGPKGSGQFERITWDAALSEITTKLQTIAAQDPQAVLPYSYAGTMGLLQGEGMATRFWNRLGASALDRTICSSAGAAGLIQTYGAKVGMHVLDFAHSRLIVIWGSNSIASNLHFWTIAQEAKRQGARIICIDPRRTATAEKCHQHIALMPGTDGALALGLMREWIVGGRVKDADADAQVSGYAELRDRAMAWTLARTAATCGLTEQEVQGLAQAMADEPAVGIRLNYGMQRVTGGGNAVRLVALLPCLLGAWQHKGGGLLLSSSGWFIPFVQRDALDRPDLRRGPAPRVINMSAIGDALMHDATPAFGPRVKALVVYNSNPVAVAPDSSRVVQGFKREDLFVVVLEHFMTDTADHADIVLPATTQLEHLDVHTAYGHTDLMFNEPAIAPLGESKPNTQIFRELAARMGFEEPCFSDSDETMARQAVDWTKLGASLEDLRAKGWVRLPVAQQPLADGRYFTADGRANAEGADFVPNAESTGQAPVLAKRFPLAMISPPARHFLNSTFVNVKSLRDVEGEPLVEMHAADAQARSIVDGAMVRIFNDRGSYLCRARVSDRARPGVVNALGIWWRKLGAAGTNINEVTSQRLTDLGGGATFYDCLVEVAPADSSAASTTASSKASSTATPATTSTSAAHA
jgi:anaerobic selenocysteine-containing dehydrogenase